MTKSNSAPQGPQGIERRRTKRLDVLETFSLFVTVPAKGPLRLRVHDISELGIGFDLDIAEESGVANLKVAAGDAMQLQLYLNQSLYLPLKVDVRRVSEAGGIRRLGTEFSTENQGTKSAVALKAFVEMLDCMIDVARIES